MPELVPTALYAGVAQVKAYLPLDIYTISDDDIEAIIQVNSRVVDDYIAAQYQIPLPEYPQAPGTVNKIVIWLTVYDLYIKAGMASEKDDPRQSNYKRAHEMLEEIRDRKIILGSGENKYGLEDEALPILTGPGRGPASWLRQERELGNPHRKFAGNLTSLPPEESQ